MTMTLFSSQTGSSRCAEKPDVVNTAVSPLKVPVALYLDALDASVSFKLYILIASQAGIVDVARAWRRGDGS